MKTLLLLAALLTALTINLFGKEINEEKNLLVGSWKYSTESAVNDFQKVSNTLLKQDYSAEYFIFEPNNRFRHEFITKAGEIVKTMKGKWKVLTNKIKIEYADFNYSLNLDYFFLDKDLVLGQNFNHVIFSKDIDNDMDNKNIALAK